MLKRSGELTTIVGGRRWGTASSEGRQTGGLVRLELSERLAGINERRQRQMRRSVRRRRDESGHVIEKRSRSQCRGYDCWIIGLIDRDWKVPAVGSLVDHWVIIEHRGEFREQAFRAGRSVTDRHYFSGLAVQVLYLLGGIVGTFTLRFAGDRIMKIEMGLVSILRSS